jgi:hypothetical protein
MAGELFFDTSGFFALLNRDDPHHRSAQEILARAKAERRGGVTTQWIVGECCTLLMARRRPHLIPRFLELTERSKSLNVIVADDALYTRTKTFLRRHLEHEYSFADCASLVVMEERGLQEPLTHDGHFTEAGKIALLR